MGNFLTKWGIISFSGRTVLHDVGQSVDICFIFNSELLFSCCNPFLSGSAPFNTHH